MYVYVSALSACHMCTSAHGTQKQACVYVCVSVCIHVRMWEHVCTHVWRPDADLAMLASQ